MRKVSLILLGLMVFCCVSAFGTEIPILSRAKQVADTDLSATHPVSVITKTDSNAMKENNELVTPPKDYLQLTLDQQRHIIENFEWAVGIVITIVLAVFGWFGFNRIDRFENDADRSLDRFEKDAEYTIRRIQDAENEFKNNAVSMIDRIKAMANDIEKEYREKIANPFGNVEIADVEIEVRSEMRKDDGDAEEELTTESHEIVSANKYFVLGNEEQDENKKMDHYKQARDYYEQAIKKDPRNVEAIHNLGVVYYKLREYSSAIQKFRQAEQIAPRSWTIYSNRGLALLELNEYGEAEKDFKKAIDLNPMSSVSYNNLGICLSRQKKYTDAIQLFSLALNLKPNYLTAMKNRGGAYTETEIEGHYENALSDFDEVLQSTPDDENVYYYKSIVFAKRNKKGDDESMFKNLEKAASKKFKNIDRFKNDRKEYFNKLATSPEQQKRMDEVEASIRQNYENRLS